MGYSWDAQLGVAYAQEVKPLRSYSRFATRCLKFRGTEPESGRGKRRQTADLKLPGTDLTEEEQVVGEDGGKSYPFSDTEEEVAAMPSKQRSLHAALHDSMDGDHENVDARYEFFVDFIEGGSKGLFNQCFKIAVEKVLPGRSSDFDIYAADWSEADHGAKEEIAYIAYSPGKTDAGGKVDRWESRHVNMPWGNKLTPVPMLSDAQRASVNAAFAVIIDRLGLTAVGEPGFKLVTTASGG